MIIFRHKIYETIDLDAIYRLKLFSVHTLQRLQRNEASKLSIGGAYSRDFTICCIKGDGADIVREERGEYVNKICDRGAPKDYFSKYVTSFSPKGRD